MSAARGPLAVAVSLALLGLGAWLGFGAGGGGAAGERETAKTPDRADSHVGRGPQGASPGPISRSPTARPRTNRAKAAHVIRHVWPAGQWVNAIRVTGCETGGTWSRWALGSAGEVSIWQIHPASHPWVNVARARRDQWYAARSALRIWRSAGWGAWTCARILGIA